MFLFHRINRSQLNARYSNDRSRLSCLVVTLGLLLVATGNASYKPAIITQAAQAEARPELVMDVTRRDFGDVFAGEELEQSFGVKNTGTAPLELANKSSLGSGSTELGHPSVAAMWRRNESFSTRRVAALRVAPT